LRVILGLFKGCRLAIDPIRDQGNRLHVSFDRLGNERICKSRSNNPSLKRLIGFAAPEQNCGS